MDNKTKKKPFIMCIEKKVPVKNKRMVKLVQHKSYETKIESCPLNLITWGILIEGQG